MGHVGLIMSQEVRKLEIASGWAFVMCSTALCEFLCESNE
jgi:hypothetical protein